MRLINSDFAGRSFIDVGFPRLCFGAILLAVSTVVYAQTASPVNCRNALRPVLMQVEPDLSLLPDIVELCEGQAANGDSDAVYHLSLLYLGLLDWQPEKAVPMIREAAENGVAEAQYWLAWQYEAGPLLENDAAAALRWYIEAGDQEHRLAVKRLLDIYSLGGLGESPDKIRAAMYRARLARCMENEVVATSAADTTSLSR